MNNDSPRQERILKIFTPVRCINRDQLLRYHRGSMTAVEKHLIEQHIVDCDLCHDALLAMSDHHLHEQYGHLTHELSQFIHREFSPPPQPDKKQQQRQIRQHRTAESLLSYFWAIMFVAIGGGSVFLLQQHLKNRPALAALPARTANALVIPAPAAPAAAVDPNYPSTQTGAGKPLVIHTQYNSSARDSINKTGNAISAASITPVKQAPKDSASLKRKAVKDSTPKTATADTNARLAVNTPATLKEDPKKQESKEAKDQKYTADESEKTPAQSEAEKNSPANNTTTAAPNSSNKSNKEESKAPASGDESLFRAAMQYQQQGDMNEAINQFKKLSGNERYSERAKYQLAMIYKNKGQNGKARRLFKEIIKMEGNMKSLAQAQLNNMN